MKRDVYTIPQIAKDATPTWSSFERPLGDPFYTKAGRIARNPGQSKLRHSAIVGEPTDTGLVSVDILADLGRLLRLYVGEGNASDHTTRPYRPNQ